MQGVYLGSSECILKIDSYSGYEEIFLGSSECILKIDSYSGYARGLFWFLRVNSKDRLVQWLCKGFVLVPHSVF